MCACAYVCMQIPKSIAVKCAVRPTHSQFKRFYNCKIWMWQITVDIYAHIYVYLQLKGPQSCQWMVGKMSVWYWFKQSIMLTALATNNRKESLELFQHAKLRQNGDILNSFSSKRYQFVHWQIIPLYIQISIACLLFAIDFLQALTLFLFW